jgi:hypothetical protein
MRKKRERSAKRAGKTRSVARRKQCFHSRCRKSTTCTKNGLKHKGLRNKSLVGGRWRVSVVKNRHFTHCPLGNGFER